MPDSLPLARTALLIAVSGLLVACGDNIGSVFDPDGVGGGPGGGGGGGGGPMDGTGIVPVTAGSFTKEGRPMVEEAFPSGSGWAPSVPAVVVFDESVDESSVAPDSGDPALYLRLEGTENVLPASYDFLSGGRVVVIRPTAPLPGDMGQIYEVVVEPTLADLDGTQFGGREPVVLTSFGPDADTAADPDGRIVATLPFDNERDAPRETDLFVVFDRPADEMSVTTATLSLRPAGGSAVMGTVSFPISAGLPIPGSSGTETRIVRLRPSDPLAGSTQHEVVVTSGITFDSGNGVLDFGNATPFADFRTARVPRPTGVTVANPTMGFDDAINRSNIGNVRLAVDVGADAMAGDVVVARVYGLEGATMQAGDFQFVERFTELTSGGAQTVQVDFSGRLGTVDRPAFEDGDLILAATLRRSAQDSGYAVSDPANAPRFDTTPPTLDGFGPPSGTDPATTLVTDLEILVAQGVASEELGAAELTVGASSAQLYAGAGDGRFTMLPITLGRIAAGGTVPFTFTMTDAAGNPAASTFSGTVTQRGVVTGALGADLTLEVFDEATLQPVVGATVVVEDAVGSVPAVVATTDTAGRAVVSTLSTRHTITASRAGYDLFSVVGSRAAFHSLPLRPTEASGSESTLMGALAFVPQPGQTALVGTNVFADRTVESIETSAATPVAISSTVIRASRPALLSAFVGTFEPTMLPAYSAQACNMCGRDGSTAEPSLPGVPAGNSVSVGLEPGTFASGLLNIVAPYNRDFASAGFGAVSETPTVRVVASVGGFVGTYLVGVGLATAGTGAEYSINASYALNQFLQLQPFGQQYWVSVTATDGNGALVRTRRLLSDPSVGLGISDMLDPPVPGVPTITAPGAPSAAPQVQFEDRLDPSVLVSARGVNELTVTDGTGRVWRVLEEDPDTTGARTIQLPDLAALGVGERLATGTWSVTVSQQLFIGSSVADGEYAFEDRFRLQPSSARSAPVSFTVQ